MLRRRRTLNRFVPRLEKLEQRGLLSANALAMASQDTAASALLQTSHPGADIAAGNVNGQLAVVGIAERGSGLPTHPQMHKPLAVEIENYNQPNAATGASVGSFTAGAQVPTDLPDRPDVKIAFGDVNNDGLDDLYMAVAAPVGKGAIAVELFQGFNSSTGWHFTLAAKSTCYGMTASGGNKGYGVVVGDINGDGKADVVLTTDRKVGFVLSNGTSYETPVVTNPFVSIEDSKNIADGAAKGQAQEGVIQNSQGGDDLVTEANNQFLFTPIVVTPGSTAQGAVQTAGFPEPIESIAINPGGTSTAQPATPIQGRITVADEIFVAGTMEDIVDPCPPHVICAGLVAVVGDKIYVGTGSTPYSQSSTGTLTPGPFTFTWSVDSLPPQLIGKPLFLTDVHNDGQLDLLSIQISKTSEQTSPKLTVVVENVFGGPLEKEGQ